MVSINPAAFMTHSRLIDGTLSFCGCTNYLNQAASVLQVMDDAAKVVICSKESL
jgi:hypothetical protein